nr:HAD hydrolase-like protein [Streptomyces lunaelactis]
MPRTLRSGRHAGRPACGFHRRHRRPLPRPRRFGPEIEQWLLSELADRANTEDFGRLREAFGLSEPAAQLWQAYVDHMAAAVSCRPAVLEALAELRTAASTIGIVTNGSSDIQRAKLAATGIGPCLHRRSDRRLSSPRQRTHPRRTAHGAASALRRTSAALCSNSPSSTRTNRRHLVLARRCRRRAAGRPRY